MNYPVKGGSVVSDMAAKASDVATARLREGFNCAESVLMGLIEAFGLPGVPASIATGFGAGIGRCGDVCGAVTGGVMGIGLKANRTNLHQKSLYDAVQAAACRLVEEFAKAEGSIYCRDLTGYDLREPGQLEKFHADPERRRKCLKFVESMATLAAEIIGRTAFPQV